LDIFFQGRPEIFGDLLLDRIKEIQQGFAKTA
jgi:hypothetical protein